MDLGLALLHGHRRALDRGGEFGDAGLERGDLVLQLDDALDAGEVDALVLGQPLDLTQELDVAGGVAAAPAGGAAGETRPRRSYWRRVWGWSPESWAATEMT